MKRHHPAQYDYSLNQKVTTMFRESMERHGVLPKNPKTNKKFKEWLDGMGCHLCTIAESRRSLSMPVTDGHVSIWVVCDPIARKNKRGMNFHYKKYKFRVEIPYDLADKMLALGFIP